MTGSAFDRNEDVAAKLARFRSVFIPYPRHVALHERCDYLQRLGRHTKGKPQMGLRVLAPTGSGKSTAALAYMAGVASRSHDPDRMRTIIKVDLEHHSTPKKLMTTILAAFGDPHASYGNELTLKRRAFACFERFGTELLIVDEVQHLNYRNGVKNDVTEALKGMLDCGVVPIVFLGTDEAAPLFQRNLQLNGRLLPPCDLLPLSAQKAGDRDLFARFVSKLEDVVLDQGILPEPSNFESQGVLPALFEVSGGVIGRVSRLFQAALEVSIRRDALRLDVSDLSWAIDNWAIEQAFITRNPLRRVRHG